MEDRAKQTEAFLKYLDLVKSEGEERSAALRGWDLFLDAGWLTNYFDAGMALRAGRGLIPDRYEGFASEAKYRRRMAEQDASR